MSSLLYYFTDPVMRGPTIGCMLMGLSASLIGVIAYLRGRSLLGETLSHCTYPGVVFAIGWGGFLFPKEQEIGTMIGILAFAFILTVLGFALIQFLEKKCRVQPDAALCFVLAAFFGLGLTLASRVQLSESAQYRKIVSYLYGQAATMTDVHIVLYGALSVIVIAVFLLFYKELQISNFDPSFAKSVGLNTRVAETLFFILTVLTVVIGVRCVGVVLMAAMFIAPAVAARQYVNKLSHMLILAAIVGLLSGFFGNFFSDQLSYIPPGNSSGRPVSMPTGPAIVLCAFALALFALGFSPKTGFFTRLIKIFKFRNRCLQENILKYFVHQGETTVLSFQHLRGFEHSSIIYLKIVLAQLVQQGWLYRIQGGFALTADGRHRALHIVRLHRLWEVYLCDYIGYGAEKVHCNAEEMEHIITPELEKELTALLKDPQRDPHSQPIPKVKEWH